MSNIWTNTFIALQNLPAATLNALTAAINAHDHSGNGGSAIPGSALTGLNTLTVGQGVIPATSLALPSANSVVMWYIDGSLVTGDGQSATIRVPFSGTITRADAYVGTAPTGANIVIAIRKNSSDIWTESPDHRLNISTSALSGYTTTFDTTAVTAGDYFNLDVDQVGSSVIGSSLTVELTILRS